MTSIHVSVDTSAATEALRAMMDAIGNATYDALYEVQDYTREDAQVSLNRRSHPAGTPTPSFPGEPPARVSGHLQSSPMWHDTDVREVGPNVFECQTGPFAVYARAQEMGRPSGGGWPHTGLPPRPYLSPVVVRNLATGRYRRTFAEFWDEAVRSVTIA